MNTENMLMSKEGQIKWLENYVANWMIVDNDTDEELEQVEMEERFQQFREVNGLPSLSPDELLAHVKKLN